jgi:hypothetical protein
MCAAAAVEWLWNRSIFANPRQSLKQNNPDRRPLDAAFFIEK